MADQVSAMPERMIKAYVSKERIEVPHPNPLIATYVYDGEPRAPDEVEGWIVIAPHSEPPVPESRLLAAEARAKAMEDGPLDYMSGKCDRLKEQNAALRADLKAAQELEQLHLQNLNAAYARVLALYAERQGEEAVVTDGTPDGQYIELRFVQSTRITDGDRVWVTKVEEGQ